MQPSKTLRSHPMQAFLKPTEYTPESVIIDQLQKTLNLYKPDKIIPDEVLGWIVHSARLLVCSSNPWVTSHIPVEVWTIVWNVLANPMVNQKRTMEAIRFYTKIVEQRAKFGPKPTISLFERMVDVLEQSQGLDSAEERLFWAKLIIDFLQHLTLVEFEGLSSKVIEKFFILVGNLLFLDEEVGRGIVFYLAKVFGDEGKGNEFLRDSNAIYFMVTPRLLDGLMLYFDSDLYGIIIEMLDRIVRASGSTRIERFATKPLILNLISILLLQTHRPFLVPTARFLSRLKGTAIGSKYLEQSRDEFEIMLMMSSLNSEVRKSIEQCLSSGTRRR